MRLYQQVPSRNSPPEKLIHFSNIGLDTNNTVWMQETEPLLPNNQFHRAVIGTQNRIMDDEILDTRDKCLRNEEVIEPPAHTTLTCRETISPPCVLNTIRIKMAVGIHKAMIEKLLHHCAFLRQETGCPYILFRVFQINGHVGSIEISGNDDILTHCM